MKRLMIFEEGMLLVCFEIGKKLWLVTGDYSLLTELRGKKPPPSSN